MRINGLHFLVTYKCNSQCAHCFLSCGPKRKGKFEFADTKKLIDDAAGIPSISYFVFEGGEPFLYPSLLKRVTKYANNMGYWTGILSNGFWARTKEIGIKTLVPLKEAGLREIGISTDEFHQKTIQLKNAKNAVKAAKKLGIDSYLMKTGKKNVICRGRGAKICTGKPSPWQKLTHCQENLDDPSRVHIGPVGSVHLCQALLIGEDARKKPLKDILENHLKDPNVIVRQLLKNGPAGLALFAQKHGFKPKDSYVQGCQLCFEARRFLCDYFPDILSPLENYNSKKFN